jgi:formylmethanofuran dehydrogenase subunit E
MYSECEECGRMACEEHLSWLDEKIVCDRCRRSIEDRESPLIGLGLPSRA